MPGYRLYRLPDRLARHLHLHRGRTRARTLAAAPAHDSTTRLLTRIEADPEVLWEEARPLILLNAGALVIDDSTLD